MGIQFPSLMAAEVGPCTEQGAVLYYQQPLNLFGNEVVTRISKDTDTHFVASSLSLWTLLASIAFGATDFTLEELENVLKFRSQSCFTRKFFEFVKDVSEDGDVVFKRSASIFGDKTLLFTDWFRRQIRATGVTKLEEIMFDNPVEVAAAINDRVEAATGAGGAADDVVTPVDADGAEVLLVDAICFRGPWKYKLTTQYNPAMPSTFYGSGGERIGKVNLIYTKLKANITDIPEMNVRVLELPYKDDRFSMLFILPNKGMPIQKVVENLKNFNLHSIFRRFEPRIVTVRIPRFKISSHSNMKEKFIDMGLKSMFDAGATFTEMAEVSFYVSTIIQRATMEVTEEGSEAASTVYMAHNYLMETMFEANRPFMYILVEKQAKIALFTGAYSKPSFY